MPVICGVDYDDTLTQDVSTWRRILCHMLNAGWTVFVCTGRNDSEGNRKDIAAALQGLSMVPVVFAGAMPKRQAAAAAGYHGKIIWIDDCPAMVDGAIPLLGGEA